MPAAIVMSEVVTVSVIPLVLPEPTVKVSLPIWKVLPAAAVIVAVVPSKLISMPSPETVLLKPFKVIV